MVHAVDQDHKRRPTSSCSGSFSWEWAARRRKPAPARFQHQVDKGRWGELTQQSQKDFQMQLPTPTNIPSLSKALDCSLYINAWRWLQHRQHSTADTDACAKLPDSEGTPLAPYIETKLPGNIAHDHIRHAHSARPHTMTSLPDLGPPEHQAARSSSQNWQNVPCFSATLSATRVKDHRSTVSISVEL